MSRLRVRGRRIPLVLAFIVCVGGSCSDSPPPDPVVAEPILDANALDQVIRGALDEFNAAEEAFTACLRGAGFDYTPRTAQVAVTSDHGGLRSRAEMIRTVGYGIVDGEAGAGVQVFVSSGGLPAAQREAFEASVSAGGECGHRLNYVDIQQVVQKYQDMPPEADERVLADPKFIEAQNNWTKCMKNLGYQFNSPIEAFSYIESKSFAIGSDPEDIAALAEEEVRIATADLDCFNKHLDPIVRELTK